MKSVISRISPKPCDVLLHKAWSDVYIKV